MKKLFIAGCLCLLFAPSITNAQFFKKISFSGMYVQWGYNKDWFSKSTLHFKNADKYDFTIHDAVAHDKPDYDNVFKNPFEVTIPQNSLRVGFYLDPKHHHAIELNFDHTKYVVDDQRARITGEIYGESLDMDSMIKKPFLHMEHTNGANFLLFNYVTQHPLWQHKKMQATVIGKIGGGIVIPRSDVMIMGQRLDNKYHIAGYIFGAEGGFRYYPLKKWFVELTGKAGFANYVNALTVESGTLKHHFYFAEVLGLVGYDIGFSKTKTVKSTF
jgi:hypothetical protein